MADHMDKQQIMKIILNQYQELKNEADELRDAVGYRDSATQRSRRARCGVRRL